MAGNEVSEKRRFECFQDCRQVTKNSSQTLRESILAHVTLVSHNDWFDLFSLCLLISLLQRRIPLIPPTPLTLFSNCIFEVFVCFHCSINASEQHK